MAIAKDSGPRERGSTFSTLPPDTGDLGPAYSLWLIRNNLTQARSQYAGREHRLTAEARTLPA